MCVQCVILEYVHNVLASTTVPKLCNFSQITYSFYYVSEGKIQVYTLLFKEVPLLSQASKCIALVKSIVPFGGKMVNK